MLIIWIRHTKSKSDLFLYKRNLKNERCEFTKVILNQKPVWNVHDKAFWYTNNTLP